MVTALLDAQIAGAQYRPVIIRHRSAVPFVVLLFALAGVVTLAGWLLIGG